MQVRAFGDYRLQGHKWITIFDTPFYPDTLEAAVAKYGPVLERFRERVDAVDSSADLLRDIQRQPKEVRGQLLRVFRKYVSPDTSVEMLKRVRKTEEIIEQFGDRFRALDEVASKLRDRPEPDQALIAVLDEYAERGKKGYPGFARYDSDRGGAQEDDRVGGNERRLREILRYADGIGSDLKVVFLNDGPGLLLGSMWHDYASIEAGGEGRALVTTLTMAQAGRFSLDWIESVPE